jgi:hypothetical protein
MEKEMICEIENCNNDAFYAKEDWTRGTDPGFKFNYLCAKCYKENK